MIIGAAGHIDHGKTALIKALTGVDADRLAEEKRRGITIDLGFAYLPIDGGDVVGFIDAPGHERFVHNMLAGAAGVDFALLVVDAHEGPRRQTIEHLAIFDLLGVRSGVVALSKCDLVSPDRLNEAFHEVRAMLAGTTLANADILPVSAVTGQGVEPLSQIIRDAASRRRSDGASAPASDGGQFRLAVDRSFTLTGIGTVVTGAAFAGSVRLDDALTLSPGGVAVRVRGIHAQNRPASEARAGDRCALNLTGPRFEKETAGRGDWIVAPALHAPVTRFDARLRLLASERRALQQWTSVRLHLAASHVGARVALLEDGPLKPGEEAFVQIVADRPIGALHGDRFIIRDQSAARTMGGGRVLDPFPPHRGRRSPERLAMLKAENQDAPDGVLAARLAAPPHWLDLEQFRLAHNRPQAGSRHQMEDVAIAGSYAFRRDVWNALRGEILERLGAYHAAYPDLPGIQANRLAPTLAFRPPEDAVTVLLKELADEGKVAPEGPWWRLSGHVITLVAEDEALWARTEPLLEAQRYCPPRARDLGRELGAPEARMRGLLKQLCRMGRAVEVAHDHYFLREAVAEMAHLACALAEEAGDGGFKAAAFRDRIGVGRKVAIQILEFFDRYGVTLRKGDLRRPHPKAKTRFAAGE
jgi:selenocysteine-specific elongation factor